MIVLIKRGWSFSTFGVDLRNQIPNSMPCGGFTKLTLSRANHERTRYMWYMFTRSQQHLVIETP